MKGRMEALARLFLVSLSVPVKKAELAQRWRATFQILRISRQVAQSPRQANVGGRLRPSVSYILSRIPRRARSCSLQIFSHQMLPTRQRGGKLDTLSLVGTKLEASCPRGFTVNQQDASLRATRNLRVALDRNRHDRVRHLDNSNF